MEGTLYYGPGKDGEIDYVTGAPAWAGCRKVYLVAGIACAQASATSVPVLYNPAVVSVVGTGWAPLLVLRIMSVRIGVVSGTVVPGSILYGIASGMTFSGTSSVGGGSINSFIGKGAGSSVKWYTTATSTIVPTTFASNLDAGGNLANGPLFNITDNIGGVITLPPGAAFWPFIANGAAAPALTATVTIDFVQTPWLSDRY